MRKLVSIQTISTISPIEGKDRIVLATVQGWQVIVKADEFSVGSKCVFYEIDSFLPIKPEYAFLGKNTTFLGTPGYRIKSMKMVGIISQGLALPLSHVGLQDLPVGTDVTDLLEVIKYDREAIEGASGALKVGQSAGTFPSFIPKTDQTRIQSLMSYFNNHKETVFEETLKLDGSSLTAYKKALKLTWWQKLFGLKPKLHFGVCSRNQELKRPDNLSSSSFWYVADKYNLSNIPEGFAIQGELIGPNIQSNHEKVSDFEFYCFDVYNIKEQRYLSSFDRQEFCTRYNIPHIPIISISSIFTECPTVESLLARVDTASINPGTISEGRVFKSVTNPSITFKVINNRYLLKEK